MKKTYRVFRCCVDARRRSGPGKATALRFADSSRSVAFPGPALVWIIIVIMGKKRGGLIIPLQGALAPGVGEGGEQQGDE
jgi:hypothetical protein